MSAPKFTCDIVQFEAEPGMKLREVERLVKERFFADFGEYKDRIVRVSLPVAGGLHVDMHAGRDTPPSKLTDSLLFAFSMMGWMPVGPDKRLLDRFADVPEAKAFNETMDDVLSLDCNDQEGCILAAMALSVGWNDFLVAAAPKVFAGGVYHQLLWIEAVNSCHDCSIMAGPLDQIPMQQLYGYFAKARDNCYRELMGDDTVISLKSRQALVKVRELFDECLRSFNDAANGRSLHPGALSVYIDTLMHDYGIEKKGGGAQPKP